MPKRVPAFELDSAAAAALADHLRDLRRREARPTTMHHREGTVRRFGRFLAPQQVLTATEADIERWIDDQLDRGLSASTRHTYLVHVSEFFKWCARRGAIAVDPAHDLVSPRVLAGRPRPIPEEDLRLALMTAGRPLRVWLVLAAYCGLRAGEIARLRREHVIDTAQPPLLLVENGKGGRSRALPLSAVVLAELAPYLSGRRGRLWLEHRKNPVSVVTQKVSQHLRSLGLPFTTHSLRHRFATQVYQRSRDLRMTQDLLGHASPATTQIYAAWDSGRGVDVVGQLGEDLHAAPALPEPKLSKRPRGEQ